MHPAAASTAFEVQIPGDVSYKQAGMKGLVIPMLLLNLESKCLEFKPRGLLASRLRNEAGAFLSPSDMTSSCTLGLGKQNHQKTGSSPHGQGLSLASP